MQMNRDSAALKRILVPVDFSGASRQALQQADRLALATGAQVVLLNVVQPSVDLEGSEGLAGPSDWRIEQKVQHMHDKLIGFASRHLSRPVNFATAVLVQPNTDRAIAEYAETIGADLITMGLPHRTSGHREPGQGSRADLHEWTSCPVMLVCGREENAQIAA